MLTITESTSPKSAQVYSLSEGDTFSADGNIYMKIRAQRNGHNAVRLSIGSVEKISPTRSVVLVKISATFKYL